MKTLDSKIQELQVKNRILEQFRLICSQDSYFLAHKLYYFVYFVESLFNPELIKPNSNSDTIKAHHSPRNPNPIPKFSKLNQAGQPNSPPWPLATLAASIGHKSAAAAHCTRGLECRQHACTPSTTLAYRNRN